jgi:AcrR family transcriptional regulator
MDDVSTAPSATLRYAKKRDAIVAAATHILNLRGVKGMTLADVAASVGLITTSVTYYFKKKEDLAAACFLSGIAQFNTLADEALKETSPEARLRRFLDLYLEAKAAIRNDERAPIPIFSDVRALNQPHLAHVTAVYADMFRKVRRLFWDGEDVAMRPSANARTHLLMEQLYWAVIWLPRYEIEDYPRIRDRIADILIHGLAPEGSTWLPKPLALDPEGPESAAQETFLVAATRLINLRGYRGASVEKISAELNVTKGSFYHHNEAKDDLVLACFERTFDMVRRVQSGAMRLKDNQWRRLSSAAACLVDYQLSDNGPLLRTSALAALPPGIRARVVDQSNRLSDRFAAMISDGIAEGSLRPVDPVIAAHMLNATLNAAADLNFWVRGVEADQAVDLYARPMLMGVLS